MAENIVELLTDVADAIREKKGTSEPINAQSFAEEIRNIESGGSGWTGHADAEGLRAIGWDDEDIAYYQKHGVNWNEEDDEYHKVSDDNKALYGVLTADNIQDYKDRIVYLPKIDFSGVTNMNNKFKSCTAMVALPMIDTSNATLATAAFYGCNILSCIPPIDLSNATDIQYLFDYCYDLAFISQINVPKATSICDAFNRCHNLKQINMDTRSVVDMSSFSRCYTLRCVKLDLIKTNKISFFECLNLTDAYLKNLSCSLSLSSSQQISKESLLYIINNEAATEAITITLQAHAYSRLAEDANVVVALANHPLISLASA